MRGRSGFVHREDAKCVTRKWLWMGQPLPKLAGSTIPPHRESAREVSTGRFRVGSPL